MFRLRPSDEPPTRVLPAPDPGSTAFPVDAASGEPRRREALAGVLRGLSAVFWGLPLTLLAFARHFLSLWPTGYDLILPPVGAGLLLFGLLKMGPFQRQERVWQRALFVAQVFGLFLVGLSPFLYLWSRMPAVDLFARAVLVLVVVALGFLVALTRALARLAAMLPDAIARGDARLFQGLAAYGVTVLLGVGSVIYFRQAPPSLSDFLFLPRQPVGLAQQSVLLILTLGPVAMSMAVAWKLKEVVFALVVGARG